MDKSTVALAAAEGAFTDGRSSASQSSRLLRRCIAHKGLMIGAAIVAVITAFALLGPFLLTGDPMRLSFRTRFLPPSAEHWFGTDHYGRDIFLRVVYGGHLSLFIGIAVVAIAGLGGTLIGALAGYYRKLDGFLMRVMDALMAFPSLMLAIGIAAALGSGVVNVVIALSIAYMPRTARIMRAAVMVLRNSEYVEAARMAGVNNFRILLRHILPNSMAPLIIDLTFIFAYAVLADAALSFLGVGPPPPTPSWGNIIADGRDYVVEAPWITLCPGIVIGLTVLGLNLFGDGLRDVLDPRLE
ncbi:MULTISPECIES: ABC transporter permease [unclassified Chelatococcus]|uniref:ABC transporter permease n=1 Tax=unclassified Chelatococcus TaxID=2638111 RepID=UPI001BCF878E|nr:MULTISPECIES: ABC transporter permease [unclassified Chelatococcus]MBS7697211.1 ABC transporter permease [Chelatococcus sp. YT9]MBX3556492.1 ABC transporter permease [Chelatococcus sp.]